MLIASIDSPDPTLTGDDSPSVFEDLQAQIRGAEAFARCRNVEATYLLGQAISLSSTLAGYVALGYSILRLSSEDLLPLLVYNREQKIAFHENDHGMLKCRCGRRYNLSQSLLVQVAIVGVHLCPGCMLGAVYLQKLEAIRATKP